MFDGPVIFPEIRGIICQVLGEAYGLRQFIGGEPLVHLANGLIVHILHTVPGHCQHFLNAVCAIDGLAM